MHINTYIILDLTQAPVEQSGLKNFTFMLTLRGNQFASRSKPLKGSKGYQHVHDTFIKPWSSLWRENLLHPTSLLAFSMWEGSGLSSPCSFQRRQMSIHRIMLWITHKEVQVARQADTGQRVKRSNNSLLHNLCQTLRVSNICPFWQPDATLTCHCPRQWLSCPNQLADGFTFPSTTSVNPSWGKGLSQSARWVQTSRFLHQQCLHTREMRIHQGPRAKSQ